MLNRTLVFSACAALAAASAFAAPSGDEWAKRWNVPAQAEIRVNVDDGRLLVTAGPANEISARVYTKGWRIGAGEVTIQERQSGARVELDIKVPRADRWFSTNNRSLRVELALPPNILAQLRTGDGSIKADNLKGNFRLKTGDGSIETNNLEGTLAAETGDGTIRARGLFDALNLNTGDGSIEADIRQGSRLSSSWDIHTGDGHITLRLPSDLSADLDVRTGDGRVDIELPVTTKSMKSHSEFRGRLNSGGATLRVRTGDGSIRLARN